CKETQSNHTHQQYHTYVCGKYDIIHIHRSSGHGESGVLRRKGRTFKEVRRKELQVKKEGVPRKDLQGS
ncbi:hypothetical protein ADUPG1_002286, partial [Aduncisulcus paluster]